MSTLIERSTGHRHGVVVPPVDIPRSSADPSTVFHATVAIEGGGFKSAGGGVARTPEIARIAAVAEALERYVATHATLPIRRSSELSGVRHVRLSEWSLHSDEQRSKPTYPYHSAFPDDEWLTEAFSLPDNQSVWVPAALVSLTEDYGVLATSSGLAADPNPQKALLRGIQEIVERDAFMTTWVHGLGGRIVDRRPADPRLGGDLRVYDITPSFSPHPVVAVLGTLELNGEPRHSIGLACRATWSEALERAELEFLQGTLFVGHFLRLFPSMKGLKPASVTGFDEHAVYYAANPLEWERLPIHRAAVKRTVPGRFERSKSSVAIELEELVSTLTNRGIRLMYRELTTVDMNQVGLHVVRALSPDLTPIHHNHNWPFLGGKARDVQARYPDAHERHGTDVYPSPFPHALG